MKIAGLILHYAAYSLAPTGFLTLLFLLINGPKTVAAIKPTTLTYYDATGPKTVTTYEYNTDGWERVGVVDGILVIRRKP